MGLIAVTVGSMFFIWTGNEAGKLKVVFFNVGQGDSAFIETPNDFQILIDGGPTSAVLEKLGEEMPFYDRTIDLIILTHPDNDHLTGLLEVLKRYEIKNILWTGVVNGAEEEKEWEKLLKEEEANIMIAQSGEKIILQGNPLIYFLVLYPFDNLEGQEIEDTNNTSVVGRLIFEDKSFLFMGDVSSKIETELIEKYGNNLNSDILKVAHHGSKYSTNSDFIKTVSPETAVISVGENNWGHPTPEVLQRLENFDIKTLITKEAGDIKFSY